MTLANADRAGRNALALTSKWQTTRPDLAQLQKRSVAISGRYDAKSLAPFSVYVGSSEVHGCGVFASEKIPAGRNIVVLPLAYETFEQSEGDKERYTFTVLNQALYKGVALTMVDVGTTNFVRFVNTAHGHHLQANVVLDWYGPIAVLRAIADLLPGAELLLDYKV